MTAITIIPIPRAVKMKSTGLSGRVGNASLKIATQKNLGIDDKSQTKPTTAKDMAADTGIERAHNSTIRATAIQPANGTPMSRSMSNRSVEALSLKWENAGSVKAQTHSGTPTAAQSWSRTVP